MHNAFAEKPELQYISLYANKKSIKFVLDALPKKKIRILEIDSLNIPIGEQVSDQMEKLKVSGRSENLGELNFMIMAKYELKENLSPKKMKCKRVFMRGIFVGDFCVNFSFFVCGIFRGVLHEKILLSFL